MAHTDVVTTSITEYGGSKSIADKIAVADQAFYGKEKIIFVGSMIDLFEQMGAKIVRCT